MKKVGILYVDDSPAQLESLRRNLTGGPYDVWTATTARSAEKYMSDADIVIIDYNMPGVNGAEALVQLRKLAPEEKQIRYYMYTTDPEAFRKHKDMGFDGVLMLKGKAGVRNQIDAVVRALKLTRWNAA